MSDIVAIINLTITPFIIVVIYGLCWRNKKEFSFGTAFGGALLMWLGVIWSIFSAFSVLFS